jgi:hypothetical protein
LMNLSECSYLVTLTWFYLLADHCELQAPKKVQKCQDRILESMLFFLEQLYPHDPLRIARIISVATEMRTLKNRYNLGELNFRFIEEIDVEVPPVFYEFCDIFPPKSCSGINNYFESHSNYSTYHSWLDLHYCDHGHILVAIVLIVLYTLV